MELSLETLEGESSKIFIKVRSAGNWQSNTVLSDWIFCVISDFFAYDLLHCEHEAWNNGKGIDNVKLRCCKKDSYQAPSIGCVHSPYIPADSPSICFPLLYLHVSLYCNHRAMHKCAHIHLHFRDPVAMVWSESLGCILLILHGRRRLWLVECKEKIMMSGPRRTQISAHHAVDRLLMHNHAGSRKQMSPSALTNQVLPVSQHQAIT